MADRQIKAAILAGGKSTRMGTDKANLELRGQTFLETVVTAAAEASLPVMVAGRSITELPACLRTRYPNLAAIPDDKPGFGPLGGLITALQHAKPAEIILLLPCDVPGITTDHIRWMISQVQLQFATSNEIEAVVPLRHSHDKTQLEPLFAAYAPTILPTAKALLTSGKRSLTNLLNQVKCAYIPLDPACHAAIADVDTPADLRAAQSTNPRSTPSN